MRQTEGQADLKAGRDKDREGVPEAETVTNRRGRREKNRKTDKQLKIDRESLTALPPEKQKFYR